MVGAPLPTMAPGSTPLLIRARVPLPAAAGARGDLAASGSAIRMLLACGAFGGRGPLEAGLVEIDRVRRLRRGPFRLAGARG